MDINQSSLAHVPSDKRGLSRSVSNSKSTADTAKSKEISFSQVSKPIELKEGQIIKGRIIDIRYNEVQIQLEPGKQIITAKISSEVPLFIGQDAQFQVTENNSDLLVLKYMPVYSGSLTDTTVLKALTASNLPLTDRNKALVTELLNNRMPVDKQTLQFLIKVSNMNHGASPLTLVLMLKNNLPLTAENIRQFEAYQNGTHQLLNDIKSISKNISDLLNLPEKLMSNENNNRMTAQDAVSIQPELSDPASATKNNPVFPEAGLPSDDMTGVPSDRIAGSQPDSSTGNREILGQVIRMNGKLIDILFSSPQSAGMSEGILPGAIVSSSSSPAPIGNLLNASDRAVLLDYMRGLPASQGLKDQISLGTASVPDILNYIRENISQLPEAAASKLLQAPAYAKLLEGAFLQKWTLTPDKLSKKAPVTELYQNLRKDMDRISQLMKAGSNATEEVQIREPVKNLQENLSFMKDLNEVFNYLQLPVQMKDRELHSDLYILTRKRNLREKSDSLSVLLHLDMSYLGSLNIQIQMNHNQIQAKFCPEDKEAGHLIEKNIPLLEDALKKKGYNMHATLEYLYEKPDFSRDFIEQDAPDNIIKRYTFDIRT